MRLVVVNRACFVQRPEWVTTGWKLLVQEAPFERDYLLPVPTGNYGSCKKQELKYAVGSAIQTRVLSLLKVGEEPLFRHRVAHFWTPHSGKNFMPTAAAAVGYEKHERDMLGGWSAQGSDKYNRIAKQRITAMQVTVARTFQEAATEDPLAEAESHACFETFMVDSGVPQVEVQRTMKLLESSNFKGCPRPPPVEPSHDEPMDHVETVMDGSLSLTDFDVPSETKKENLHTLYSTVRSGILGVDPKSVRNEMRLKLEAGYYLSETGRKGTLILHKLGACFAIPGLDYMKFSYIGPALPPRSQYHQICKLCARSEKLGDSMGDSSDTQTSSSSEES